MLLPSVLLGLMLHQPAATASDAASRLAVIRNAADFSLTTHDGGTLRLSDLRGKVLLVSFVFTTCNGTCPATTHRMGQVQDALKRKGLWKESRVQLLSISLDPARDTPDVLRQYMQIWDVDPSRWTFLTGPTDRVKKVIRDWSMWVKAAPNGQLDHPSRIFLVDGRGRVREIYSLDFLKAPWVVEDIELLLHER
jgi:protein SCO1/2